MSDPMDMELPAVLTFKAEANVARYLKLRAQTGEVEPKVALDGGLYPLEYPCVFVTNIVSLEFCTYQIGLEAKLYEETGEIPSRPAEVEQMLEEGTDRHSQTEQTLGVPPENIITGELTEDQLRDILLGKERTVAGMPINCNYKGLQIRGRADLVKFAYGSLAGLEEWKYPKRGVVKSYHETQILLYAWLFHKWLGDLDIPYTIKAWKRKEDKAKEPPTATKEGVFRVEDIKSVENTLEAAYNFFTGATPCRPDPSTVSCRYCRMPSDVCSHKDTSDYRGIGAHIVGPIKMGKDGDVIINFGK